MRKALRRLHWILSTQFGFDPLVTFRSAKGLPRFLRDLARFRSEYDGALSIVPCLHDWYAEGGVTGSEYFWQDLIVARRIFAANPRKHVDVGSRVDGFVAHVASFREIEVFDVRPITAEIPGVVFKQADLTRPLQDGGYCDSLSCLHALEHFGLGRYGDPIDPGGFDRGLGNMASLLTPQGTFYLSVPIGRSRVEFNANRVCDPRTVVAVAGQHSLRVTGLSVIYEGGRISESSPTDAVLNALAEQSYALGLFTFVKNG